MRDRATLTLVSGPNAGAIHSLLIDDERHRTRQENAAIRVDDPGISRTPRAGRAAGPRQLHDRGPRLAQRHVRQRRASRPAQRWPRAIAFASDRRTEFRFGFTDEAEEAMLRRLYESSVLDALDRGLQPQAFRRAAGRRDGLCQAAQDAACRSSCSISITSSASTTRIGHLGGDHVLRSVAGLVKRTLRAEDVFARYGGEEFAVIARGIDVERGVLFAERIRTTVASARIEFNRTNVPITVSLGVASLACCGEAQGNEVPGGQGRRAALRRQARRAATGRVGKTRR